jgi:serine/threonine protein kinase
MELSQIDRRLFMDDCPGLALSRHLKTGGQKCVWQCAFRDRAYVFKAFMASDQALSRISREIQIMQSCDSPYLPKFGPLPLRHLTLPTGEQVVYFLEQYIDGVPLASVNTPAPSEQVVALGRCVGEALRELAAQGYVHRDVKPLNIMQKTSSTYVLIDGGLALDIDGEALSVVGNQPVGTSGWYSPEQMELPSRELDARSDLFSLGMTMYDFATGKHPFWNEELPRIHPDHNIKNLDLVPPDPRTFVANLGEAVCSVIMKLLLKDRDSRYQTADELLLDLDHLS